MIIEIYLPAVLNVMTEIAIAVSEEVIIMITVPLVITGVTMYPYAVMGKIIQDLKGEIIMYGSPRITATTIILLSPDVSKGMITELISQTEMEIIE